MASISGKNQVSIPAKMAFGMGHGLMSAKNMLFHFFFLFFFSNVLGVSEALVFLVTLIALAIDAVTDPVMGQISDNYRSKKWGRRHGFMLWAILPTAAFLALLFAPPAGLGPNGLFLWMMFFAITVRLGLTVYGVPYYTLGAELSTHYNERTSIFGYREFFNNIFNIAVVISGLLIFLPATAQYEDGMLNKEGYAPFALTWAIIAVITSLVMIYGTRKNMPDPNRYADDTRTKWTDTFAQLAQAMKVKPFVWLCLGYSLLVILYGASSALGFYHLTYLWQLSQEAKSVVSIAPLITLIPCVMLAYFLAAKFDKKPAAIALSLVYVFCIILPNAAYLAGLLPETGSGRLLLIIAAMNGIGYMGFTGVIILANSMMADVADAMELETSKRQEGVLYAAFSFAQKLTFVAGTGVASLSLILINFPRQAQPSEVPQSAINGLAIASIVTAIVFGPSASPVCTPSGSTGSAAQNCNGYRVNWRACLLRLNARLVRPPKVNGQRMSYRSARVGIIPRSSNSTLLLAHLNSKRSVTQTFQSRHYFR